MGCAYAADGDGKDEMYRRILAFNFDGTLAQDGHVPLALQKALQQSDAAGYRLFMVTGRRFGDAELGLLEEILAGIVWENGAVLHHTSTDEVYLPFGHTDPRLVEALQLAHVPLEQGRAIVSTSEAYDEDVWQVLSGSGVDAVVTHDRDMIRILPPGAAKGAGLERLLGLCGLSPRNLVGFGDGEGDLSLLLLGEFGVAVADAVPSLKRVADLVTDRPGPAGVLEALETYWLPHKAGSTLPVSQHARSIPLGQDEAGDTVSIPASALAAGNLGVFGDSGSGKSWVAGLLAEGMHHAGYQVLLIDPEGDFRGMRTLPGIAALEVTKSSVPPPALISELLEAVAASVVVDMSSYPLCDRAGYVADLLHALDPLRSHIFRPHWIVLEEAQKFVAPGDNSVWPALRPMFDAGGWAFVSYRPDRLNREVLGGLDQCVITRLSDPEAMCVLRQTTPCILDASPTDTPHGHAWLCGQDMLRLRPSTRRVPHIRHLHKYLDTPLPEHKRFFFRDERGFLGMEAASLFEFLLCLRKAPAESLAYHQQRGDFAKWIAAALGDGILADQLRKLAQRRLEGEVLREALLQRVATHCEELRALHS
jgi:hydroxymethylpyrimidine pyrophosphatase-like HAD family hydrolase